jgi:hypothetical protein
MSRSHRFGHYSSMDETLAMLPKPGGSGGSMTYQTDIFNLATLKAAGATMNGTFSGKALPANARVFAMEYSVDILFTADGLSSANGQSYIVGGNDPQRKPNITTSEASFITPVAAGGLFAQDMGYVYGTNVFAKQGGNMPTMGIALAGANFNNLTAGQITLRTYYAIIP